MRLIDGDTLWEKLDDEPWYDNADRDEIALPIVAAAPTVDAVPVVRCKDCKYYNRGELLATNKFCFRLKHPTENRLIGYNFAPDDFCSYGERKDGDTDGS